MRLWGPPYSTGLQSVQGGTYVSHPHSVQQIMMLIPQIKQPSGSSPGPPRPLRSGPLRSEILGVDTICPSFRTLAYTVFLNTVAIAVIHVNSVELINIRLERGTTDYPA